MMWEGRCKTVSIIKVIVFIVQLSLTSYSVEDVRRQCDVSIIKIKIVFIVQLSLTSYSSRYR